GALPSGGIAPSSTDVKTELAAGSPGRRIGLPRFPFMIAATVVRSTLPFGFGPLWQSRQYVRKTGRTSLANVTFAAGAGGGSAFGSTFFGSGFLGSGDRGDSFFAGSALVTSFFGGAGGGLGAGADFSGVFASGAAAGRV